VSSELKAVEELRIVTLAPWGGRAAIMDMLAEAHAAYQVHSLPAKRLS
jgi:hypothetical protein